MIKLFIFDIDGTLTDGGYYSPSVPELRARGENGQTPDQYLEFPPEFFLRKFKTQDFVGIKMLSDAGIHCVTLTGSSQASVPQFNRAGREISVCCGVQDKHEFVRSTYVDCSPRPQKYGWDEIAFIGDEINDCRLLECVGLAACPADASKEVQSLVSGREDGFIMSRKGGELCVREFTDLIRDLQGIRASWCNWKEK